jgi:hypothetical protein
MHGSHRRKNRQELARAELCCWYLVVLQHGQRRGSLGCSIDQLTR